MIQANTTDNIEAHLRALGLMPEQGAAAAEQAVEAVRTLRQSQRTQPPTYVMRLSHNANE